MDNYNLKGNPVIQNVPIIGNIVYDDLGEALISKYNEIFKGTPAEHKVKYKKGQIITNSNVPLALKINQMLSKNSEFSGLGLRVLTPVDVIQHWGVLPERDPTYADTNSIVANPNKGANEDLRQDFMNIKGKKSKIPLVVSGLDVEKVYNDYGFKFIGTDFMEVEEAEHLTKNGRLAIDEDGKIVSSDKGVPVYVDSSQSGSSQSGLRRLYRYGNGLGAWNGNLLSSSVNGRVQIYQDPKGLAQDFQKAYALMQRQAEEQKAVIDERTKKAEIYLKTGKFE